MAQGGMNITACLDALRMVDAAAVAQAAATCVHCGSEREAIGISMPLDVLFSEAQTLHRAVYLLSRMERESALPGT